MFPGIGRFSCFLPEVKSLYAGLDLACFSSEIYVIESHDGGGGAMEQE